MLIPQLASSLKTFTISQLHLNLLNLHNQLVFWIIDSGCLECLCNCMIGWSVYTVPGIIPGNALVKKHTYDDSVFNVCKYVAFKITHRTGSQIALRSKVYIPDHFRCCA
jgi:hypothetical protein